MVVGTLKISLDRHFFFTKKEFSRVLSCHVAVSSEWYCNAVDKIFQQCLCVEQSCELCTDIRGRGGASNVC